MPAVVPPGPDNPLGSRALYLGLPSYLIHGTNRPWGIGMRVSNGCIRLYPEDIEALYEQVPVGTPVRIVSEPLLFGERDGVPVLQAFRPPPGMPAPVTYTPLIEELVRRYGNPAQHRHSIQVEINRKLYMDEATLAQHPEGMARLQADLQALVHKLLAHDPR